MSGENYENDMQLVIPFIDHNIYLKILDYIRRLAPHDSERGKPLAIRCEEMEIEDNEPIYQNVRLIITYPELLNAEEINSRTLKGLVDILFPEKKK